MLYNQSLLIFHVRTFSRNAALGKESFASRLKGCVEIPQIADTWRLTN